MYDHLRTKGISQVTQKLNLQSMSLPHSTNLLNPNLYSVVYLTRLDYTKIMKG